MPRFPYYLLGILAIVAISHFIASGPDGALGDSHYAAYKTDLLAQMASLALLRQTY